MANKNGIRIALMILGCTAAAGPSYAYLDPGTGSIILQSILASIAVALGVLRLYWYRLKAFLSGKSSTPETQESKDPEVHTES